MRDILFLFPLYYTANAVDRFAQYLGEERSGYSFDVFMPCSNAVIFDAAKERADKHGFVCDPRPNYGAGAGALWWLQKVSGATIDDYRYIWYFEESCEPVRPGWMLRLIGDMDAGIPVAGWWWRPEGRRRPHAIPHVVTGSNGSKMIYYENTESSGYDEDGKPFCGMYDTPGYRHESFVIRSGDFLKFDFPDPTDPVWEARNGIRTYGVKAERFWWRVQDVALHGISLPSPNIQWHLLTKYNYVPSPRSDYHSYFRELPLGLRRSEAYHPRPLVARRVAAVLAGSVGRGVSLVGRVRQRPAAKRGPTA